MSCLVLFKSITYAQNALFHINNNGIHAVIIRKASNISGNGCGYCIKISESNLEKVYNILNEKKVNYISVWKNTGSEWVRIK